MSSIIDFSCQSKNRNVESKWKFQGQSILQMRIMLKNSSHKKLTSTLTISHLINQRNIFVKKTVLST